MESKKNKTVQVKQEVHKKVAVYCAENEESIGDFFSDAAIEKLEKEVVKNKKLK